MSDNKKNKQDLIDAVIEEIKNDLNNGDETAIDSLLSNVSINILIEFLPEMMGNEFKKSLLSEG